jgi:hypothetical protein
VKNRFVVAVLIGLGASIHCGPGADSATRSGSDGGKTMGGDGAVADSPGENDAITEQSRSSADALSDSWPDNPTADAITDASVDVPSFDCPIQQTTPAHAAAARSAGYSGTDAAYNALYGASCQVASDCAPACAAAGGTMASCASGSECLVGSSSDGGLGCLPPTYWRTVTGALSESNMTTNAAELILVAIPYDDALLLTNFGVSIPDNATVTGIQFKIRRATITGSGVDDRVQVLQNGAALGGNQALPDSWPGILTYASYGGAYELWGASWTPADIRSSGFGVSIAPKYIGPSAGNERAYIDSVRVTVFYRTPCD